MLSFRFESGLFLWHRVTGLARIVGTWQACAAPGSHALGTLQSCSRYAKQSLCFSSNYAMRQNNGRMSQVVRHIAGKLANAMSATWACL